MGQIVIDIPSKKKRRYVLTDASRAEMLLDALDTTAVRVKSDQAKLTRQEQEDIRDAKLALRSLKDYRKTNVSYSIEELAEEFGL